jgi:hypothetical protein
MKTPATMRDVLEITTSVGCPNGCKICPQELFVGRYRSTRGKNCLSVEDFKKYLDEIPTHVRIDFSGFTEPWSNSACTEMILHAHQTGFEVTAFTTCVGMMKSDVEKIKHIPFVTFAVHLPDDKSNMPFPKMSGYKDILRYVCSSHITNMNFMTMGSLHPDLQDLFHENVSGFLYASRAGNVGGRKPIRKAGSIRCVVSPKLHRNVLLPNGDVVLCCHDYGLDDTLGNLNTCTYEDLFAGPQYKNILARQNNENMGDILCRYCDWSGSRMRAKCIFLRESVKEAIQPVKKKVKRILKGGAGNPARRSTP